MCCRSQIYWSLGKRKENHFPYPGMNYGLALNFSSNTNSVPVYITLISILMWYVFPLNLSFPTGNNNHDVIDNGMIRIVGPSSNLSSGHAQNSSNSSVLSKMDFFSLNDIAVPFFESYSAPGSSSQIPFHPEKWSHFHPMESESSSCNSLKTLHTQNRLY